MSFDEIEYGLVLIGWVIALSLGAILWAIKPHNDHHHINYEKGKRISALVLLLFGAEMLFQWLIRFYLDLREPILSISVYLFIFSLASQLIAAAFSSLLTPGLLDRRQKTIAVVLLSSYFIFLLINYVVIKGRSQLIGIFIGCVLLFIINCISIYKCIVIYRKAMNDLRTFYSDVIINFMRWMPGVGVGDAVFLLAAPITCFCPRIVGIYQLALGIIMIIYTFVNFVNFSYSYRSLATVLHNEEGSEEDDYAITETELDEKHGTTMSEALQQVMRDKEQRWQERKGYRIAGITIEQAAREMGTNRSYLSRYLNEIRNMTFYEWVARMRINEAQSLMLENRDESIEQIASKVGFSSHSTFSSTFKKLVGTPPNKWRNQN